MVALFGRLPARLVGLGEDEARSYWEQLCGWLIGRCWASRDGFDYLLATRRIRIPCIGIRGSNDRLVHSEDHRALMCMNNPRFHVVDGPGHFGIIRHAGPLTVTAIRSHESTP